MVPVQFRTQVVQGDHRPLAPLGRVIVRLGQQAGQGSELGLAARQRIAAGDFPVAHRPVGAVWPHRGVAHGAVALTGQQQRVSQRHLVPAPTGLQLQALQLQPWRQIRGDGHRTFLQAIEVLLAPRGQWNAGFSQFVIPGIQLAWRRPGLEQGVALLERPRVTAPQGKKVRFHVEQSPIDETPARFAAPTHERMAAGLEGDHRQRRAQRPQLRHILAIKTALPGLPAMAQAGAPDPFPTRGAGTFLPFDEDLQGLGAFLYQSIADPPPETAPVSHQVQGFQQAGLAGTVVPRNQVDPRAGSQLHGVEPANAVQRDTDDVH